ncbi:hypothetical protein GCM10023238_30750 [Streptomyces heliomycini]
MTPVAAARAVDPERATLDKAAAENFPVAPFFLPRPWRDDLMAVYGFARLVDDIGDGDLAPGGADARLLGVSEEAAEDRLTLLDAFEADLNRVFDPAGPEPRHPLLRRLRPTVRRHALTPAPFLGLIAANRQDQLVKRYETTTTCSPTASCRPTPSAASSSPSPAPRRPSASAAPTRSAPPSRSSSTSRTSQRTSTATASTCPPRT